MSVTPRAVVCTAAPFLLWIAAIAPRMTGRPQKAVFEKGRLFAHRGLYDNKSQAPENSMAAFLKAAKEGFGIELDVQLTKDCIPVVFHDFSLERACGVKGLVRDYTYEELQAFDLFGSGQKIPALRDVLDLVDARVPLIIEYKSEDTDMSVVRITDPILKGYRGLYCIESFNPLVLLWYRRHRPEVVRGQLSDGFVHQKKYQSPVMFMKMLPFEFLLGNFLSKPDFIAYNHKYRNNISRLICCRILGAESVAWTIRSRRELADARRDFGFFIFDSFVPKRRTR